MQDNTIHKVQALATFVATGLDRLYTLQGTIRKATSASAGQ